MASEWLINRHKPTCWCLRDENPGGWHQAGVSVGILVLWLLVGYWWDEVQNRWDPSHFMPSQTPTNHPSQFFWHCHNSVPKWKVSNKIIFERIIESKSFILNRNLAFICQLFGNWQGESVKNRLFYGQADHKGGRGGSATSALTVSKCENFDFFSLILDSLTLKTHLFSL